MDIRTIDQLVAKVINHLKEDTEVTRVHIVEGDLDIEQYRKETGVLLGVELAMQVLIDEAEKLRKSEIDDE